MPFRVDCTYMLTSWATIPEDEHRLLTRSLFGVIDLLADGVDPGTIFFTPFEIRITSYNVCYTKLLRFHFNPLLIVEKHVHLLGHAFLYSSEKAK